MRGHFPQVAGRIVVCSVHVYPDTVIQASQSQLRIFCLSIPFSIHTTLPFPPLCECSREMRGRHLDKLCVVILLNRLPCPKPPHIFLSFWECTLFELERCAYTFIFQVFFSSLRTFGVGVGFCRITVLSWLYNTVAVEVARLEKSANPGEGGGVVCMRDYVRDTHHFFFSCFLSS